MVLKSFEDRLERLVEGVFSRAFKSGLQPVEVGRRLVREMESSRTVDPAGRPLAPNRFVIRVAVEDFQRFAQVQESLLAELTATVRGYAAQENLNFLGRVSIEFQADPSLRVGVFRLHPSYDERIPGAEPDGWLEDPNGAHYKLKNSVMTIGRLSGSDIVIDDQNVSRQHAELHPMGDSYQLIDLGSTNGCKVNGQRVDRHILVDGDEITLGPVNLRFRRP
ncbi:MAG: FhaA domain-containing protein [Acidimicrobiales bacterium]